MARSDATMRDGKSDMCGSTAKYEPPRVEKSRRLAEITGQGAVVPSGAPVPPPVDG